MRLAHETQAITESTDVRQGIRAGGRPVYDAVKRFIDVAISLTFLVLLSPLWLAIALGIRRTSPGGALFRGRVVGRFGQEFTYYKFRTMYANSDNRVHQKWLEDFVKSDRPFQRVDTASGSRPVYKVVNDPRVTSVGYWLRRTSLDEVPQLINVLRGEMSLIGPRPPVTYEYVHYDDYARQRLLVKPGITGLYQVTARSAVGFREMVAIDLDYIQRRSLFLDLSIMVRTPWVMLLGKGAS